MPPTRTIPHRLRRGEHGLLGLAVFLLVLPLTLANIEPLPTYWYLFAWYPLLLVLDALAMRRRGTSLLVDRPLASLCLFAWSVPFWLFFELLNLRLENWFYVDAPNDLLAGRLFLIAAFATVLPGIVLAYDLLAAYRVFETSRSPTFRLTPRHRRIMLVAGLLSLALPLLFPVLFFPLVWGAPVLLLEPLIRWPRRPSLLRDLERGRPARLYRLLIAGAGCGLFWELMNLPARARWIYTVPGLDRLFTEMPPLGFLGFLPFALAAYSFLRALELAGLSVPFEAASEGPVALRIPPLARLLALPAVVVALSMISIVGLETRTVASRTPRVRDLPSAGVRESAALALKGLGDVAPFLAATDTPDERAAVARWLLIPETQLARLVSEARLAAHRGIGTQRVRALSEVGVDTLAELSRREPGELQEALRNVAGTDAVPTRRVRTWIASARE